MDSLKARWNALEPWQQAVAAVGGLFGAYVFFKFIGYIAAAAGLFGLILILFVPYWIPSVVAFRRNHANKNSIVALNLFLGWTFIGWVVSLVWSLSSGTGSGSQVIVNNYNKSDGS